MSFEALKSHHADNPDRAILDLFDADRAGQFSVAALDMLFDYSKTQIDGKALELLVNVAEGVGVSAKARAMMDGAVINETEGRAVLHTALRRSGGSVMVDGADVMPGVLDTRARMAEFADAVRDGSFGLPGGAKVTDVVNIGIGGSDLGPAMAVQALSPYADGPRCHFVSNVDGAHIADVLKGLDAASTLGLFQGVQLRQGHA